MRVVKMFSQVYGTGAGHVRTADARSDGWTDGWRRSLVTRWPALEPFVKSTSARWPALERFLNSTSPGRLVVATAVLLCLGVATVGESVTAFDGPPVPPDTVALEAAIAARTPDQAGYPASRSTNRADALAARAAAKAQALKAPTTKAPATKAPATKAPAKKAARTLRAKPVAGLDQSQMDNAAAIVRTAYAMKLPKRAAVIAVATAMQESQLYNLASDVLPESSRYPHQGSGSDHDSVGLFQQRSSTGWGPVRELMTPEMSARKFLAALSQVPGWQNMELTYAAQAVQYSAFPEAYAKHEYRAAVVVNALS